MLFRIMSLHAIKMSGELKYHLVRVVLLCALCMAVLVSPCVSALGMGEIQVSSNLGEPLKAQIDLVELTAADARGLDVHLANVDEYQKRGLQYPEGIHFTF